MDPEKKAKLEAKGFKFGTAAEFLGLSPAEQAVIDVRRALARTLRTERVARGIQQEELAAKASTTQKRVSLMENGDASVSLDRLFVANVALGLHPADLLRQISREMSGPYADHRPSRAPRVRRTAPKERKAVGV